MIGTDPMSPHKPWNDDESPPVTLRRGYTLGFSDG
jgi:hypothetical protein